MHQPLVMHPVADDIGHGNDLQSVSGSEFTKVGKAGHGAVNIHDLANDSGRSHACDRRQIHRSFGLTGAFQRSSLSRSQGKNMARPEEVGRSRGPVDGHPYRFRSVVGGDPGVTRPRASIDTVKAVP